jgi:hypothetical protein
MQNLFDRLRSKLIGLSGHASSAVSAFIAGINGVGRPLSASNLDSAGRAAFAVGLKARKFDMPLEFGETPWDNLSKDELLLEVKRLYAATVSLHGSLSMCADMSRGDPYFAERTARGYKALRKGEQALAAARRTYSDEDISRAYFRYAGDALFSGVGDGWMIDDNGRMWAAGLERATMFDGAQAEQAGAYGMTGTLRKLTLADLTK